MNKALFYVVMAFLVSLLLPLPGEVHAEDDVAYFVANDALFDQITGIRSYLTNDGVKIIHITPSELDKLKNIKRYVVFGSPDDTDAIGNFIRTSLNEKQLSNARRMGKAALVSTTVSGNDVLVFATSFSMKSLVKATAGSWKEYFESWYGVTVPITQIIGY
ncbi:MAG: hypothetical protein AB7E32_16285 [Desulfovibrio sp.]